MLKVYLDKKDRDNEMRLRRAEDALRPQQQGVEIFIARDVIPRGSIINYSMVEIVNVYETHMPPQAITSFEVMEGMAAVVDIAKGEPITAAKLASPSQTKGTSLSVATPVGKRAITIPVDNISSVGGMIKPRDYVDVISIVPAPFQTPEGKTSKQEMVLPLFQNVLVLAVGQRLSEEAPTTGRGSKKKKKETPVMPIITLALSTQEANIITFVQEQGKLRLILRSPADSMLQPVEPITWDVLFRYFMPPPPEVEEKPKEVEEIPERPQNTIEIYRGTDMEVIPLTR